VVVRFEFGENTFLASPAVMKRHNPTGSNGFIGNNDFVLIATLGGNKQAELDWFFLFDFYRFTDK